MLKLYNMWKIASAKWNEVTAVVEKDKKISYKDLDILIDEFSDNLEKVGLKSGDRVVVCSVNSINYIVCMLSIWKIGATIVPITNTTPVARVEYIINNSNAAFVIKDDGNYINIEKCSWENNIINYENKLAYIIYTSGTSGVPKGVMVEQESVINLIDWYANTYDISVGTNTANLASIGFDVSMEEILGTIFRGATLFIPTKKEKSEKNSFKNFIERNSINIIQLVPFLLNVLVGENAKLDSIGAIICGGEALSEELKNKVLLKGYNLFNHYGPTEGTVDTTYSKCKVDEAVNIGYPISNVECFVIDENGNAQYRNCTGEMYISGAGLAIGYVNNEDATNDSFIVFNGKRAYKTGDYVRINEDGKIYFEGRKDTQIQINGVRIEILEIENYIKNENIFEDFLVCISNKPISELVLFYIMDKEIDSDELTARLKLFLPYDMIPKKFIRVDKLPLLESGKLVRTFNEENLEEFSHIAQKENTDEEYNETEGVIINKIAEIVEKTPSELSLSSDLLNIGFDSISFIRFVVEIEDAFDLEFEDSMIQLPRFRMINDIVEYVSKLIKE